MHRLLMGVSVTKASASGGPRRDRDKRREARQAGRRGRGGGGGAKAADLIDRSLQRDVAALAAGWNGTSENGEYFG